MRVRFEWPCGDDFGDAMQKRDVFWLCGAVLVMIPALGLLVPMPDDRAPAGQVQIQNTAAGSNASRT